MPKSVFTPEDYEVIDRAWQELREAAAKRCHDESELAVVERAFNFANNAHKDVRRRSGEPYMLHPIAVAKIVVSEIGLGYKSISAALLHDVVEDTDCTLERLSEEFGPKIASFVDGLTKIKNVLREEQDPGDDILPESIQAENLKRILLTLNDDVRVVLIKMADRLHNCRTIEYMPENKRDKILSETMFLFIPLAHQLGLYAIKTEMENIWLRFKEPEAFREITRKVKEAVKGREKEIEAFLVPVREAITKAGFNYEIKTRIKTPYSIWRKMHTKGIPFEEVYDLFAVRIIFDSESKEPLAEREECYRIFSIITGIYGFMPNRVRDWVNHPKSNNYEALHCTLLSDEGVWIEVQIRSRRMDDIAEKGIAAHWSYKQDGVHTENDSEIDKWLAKVKDILQSPDISALDMLDTIHNDLTEGEISVFTPKGERKTIVKGATALDFAYMIHTHIGNKAAAAKVNFKLLPLSATLRNGDQVEILTDDDAVPQREWLQFVKTRKARTKILDYFKNERQRNIELGRKLLKNQVEALGYSLTDDVKSKLLTANNLTNIDELYVRTGLGMIRLNNLSTILGKGVNERNSLLGLLPWRRGKAKEAAPEGAFLVATCCNPLPSDAVVGIKTPDGNVTIHKKTCKIAEEIGAKHGDWLVEPDWTGMTEGNSYPVTLSLRGIDRLGLLNDVTKYLSFVMGCNIRKLNISSEEGLFEGYIELFVRDRDEINTIVRRLGNLDGILSVKRMEN